ncbi:glycosyltransferase family 4 protein [Reyranella sp. CPCC 100927]|uniref:glycosyltransferase family 4 protein n=1 Tax=Reyranella sp. CPCC 100927 TaxID=2599616 RepID=UPI0011B4C9D3|nr:glycosyltransferase family 4 protein [Reyranella sp. CPCC 100927]TWT05750.1 glycosyltransferase family 4 protein [Reyranella sp. CPCC 100927]
MPDAKKYRVAYLVTHPIQYQAPLLQLINNDPDIYLKAFFASDFSARHFVDPEFGQKIVWDVPLLDGYEHEVLPTLPGLRYPGDAHFDSWRPFSVGLRHRLRAGRFDALWIHGYARVPHLWAMIAARSAGVRVLLRDETSALGRSTSRTRHSAKRALFTLIDRQVDAYLTIGSMNERHLLDLGIDARKFFRVCYAVDNTWFQARAADARPHREALQAELGLPPGRPIALYAAKLIDRKAPLELIQAFSRAMSDIPASQRPILLMAGDGDLRPQVEVAIAALGVSESIRLLGFQSQQRLAALYDLCDVFALPSAHETWGLVVNEVMNAGKPVIASDRVGAARDLIQDGVNGFVYPFGDTEALAQCLRKTLTDRNRLASMGIESRRMIDTWSFDQNLAGLKTALAATVGVR